MRWQNSRNGNDENVRKGNVQKRRRKNEWSKTSRHGWLCEVPSEVSEASGLQCEVREARRVPVSDLVKGSTATIADCGQRPPPLEVAVVCVPRVRVAWKQGARNVIHQPRLRTLPHQYVAVCAGHEMNHGGPHVKHAYALFWTGTSLELNLRMLSALYTIQAVMRILGVSKDLRDDGSIIHDNKYSD